MLLKSELIKKNYIYLIFFLTYFLSFGLSLLNNGIYFDDWVLYGQSRHSILVMFTQAAGTAGYIIGYIHIFLLSLGHAIFFYRLLTFAFFFLAGIFLYRILDYIDEIDPKDRIFVILLFLLLPFNNARNTLICFGYSFCYFSFFAAFYVFSKYRDNPLARLVSLVAFFFSFFTNTILCFYGIFLLFIVYKSRKGLNSFWSVIRVILMHIDYFIAPILFWIIKNLFFQPTGLYEGYNEITVPMVLNYPYDKLIGLLWGNIQGLLNLSFIKAWHIIIMLLFALVFFFFPVKKLKSDTRRNDFMFLVLGILSMSIAVFPYAVIGKDPHFYDWGSRYQLLLPLGASFVLYYGLRILVTHFFLNKSIFLLLMVLYVIILIITNINIQLDFLKDWYKQASILNNFNDNEIIKNNTTFMISDNTPEYNVNKRTYRFYEYTGLMKRAYGNEVRFVLEGEFQNIKSIEKLTHCFTEEYNMKDYKLRSFEYTIKINPGTYSLTAKNCLKLIYYENFKNSKFNEQIKNIIKLEIVKM